MFRGDRLLQLRKSMGYSQEELGEILDLSLNQVSKYELGQNKPGGDVIGRMASVLNVSADYLLGLSDDAAPSVDGGLTPYERRVIAALRRGDKIKAIGEIVDMPILD